MPGPRPLNSPCKHTTPDVPVCAACARNRARVARWYAEHPKRAQRRVKRWERLNPERKKAKGRAWNVRHANAVRASRIARSALERGATVVDARLSIEDVYRADDGRCQLCLEDVPMVGSVHPNNPSAPTIDHKIPVSHGGAHTLENVHLAHRSCNSARGSAPFVFGMFADAGTVPASRDPVPF